VLRRRGVDLINESAGGKGTTGWIPSEETRRKIGEANKHTPKATGERHGMYGKKHTPESLAKMSEARKGLLAGEKHPMYGKHHSEESRRKISENRKGKMVGADNPFYGKKHTPEALEKMRSVHVGRKQSPEEIAKRRELFINSEYFKSIKKPVLCLTNNVVYESASEAARQLGLLNESVRAVCKGKLKKTGGYKFEWSKK
jgi:group I intron endonuclease